MSGIVWLASYPKSGSTWVRLILANLDSENGPADINTPAANTGMASSRETFDDATLLASGLLTHDEADRIRPRVYEAVAREAESRGDTHFIKAHDAWRLTPAGEPLLAGTSEADRALLIVRDPRDVAVSLAWHIGSSIGEAIEAMGDDTYAFCEPRLSQAPQLRQFIGSWSAHAESWLDRADMPVHVLRYEDIEVDAVDTFCRAMAFVGHDVPRHRISRAVEFSAFAALQEQEREKGFSEASREGRGPFFRSGHSGAWRRDLSAGQALAIEQRHGAMMRRLGYAEAGPAPRDD